MLTNWVEFVAFALVPRLSNYLLQATEMEGKTSRNENVMYSYGRITIGTRRANETKALRKGNLLHAMISYFYSGRHK